VCSHGLGGLARGELGCGSVLVDVFPRWGRLVLGFGWIFTLIWVPLIMVPDTWETEQPRLLPLNYECVLGFAPILNVVHHLLRLHLCAAYLSRGIGGSAPHPYFSPIF
jgi:hypothetical protein